MRTRESWNGARYVAGSRGGHYESWFQRCNHPTRPQALWIRYTIFSPKGAPQDAQGELWAMWFDADKREILGFYQALPITACSFATDHLRALIGASELTDDALKGQIDDDGRRVSWDLRYAGASPPLLLYPESYYFRALPKAKQLTANPLVRYNGVMRLPGGREERIDDWLGCQSHNWGPKHTDFYVWAQVAGFEGAPDAYLECATAKLKIAGIWLPNLSPLVLRLDGEDFVLSNPRALWKNRGRYGDWRWQIDAHGPGVDISAVLSAPREAFLALPYRNPPGGVKRCLNSKLARCEVTIKKDGAAERRLVSNGAAFEILGDAARQDAFGFTPASAP
jgi:hypothetical protein